jgi:hypothetical protein
MKPINHIPSPSSPLFTSPSHKYPPTHTHCTYFTCLSFSTPSQCSKG